MADPFDLARFIQAQEPLYAQVLAELRSGSKQTHWMWFIFPQLAGLAGSAMSRRYAISGLDEARAYLAHRLLGARLRECTQLLNAVSGRSAQQVLGTPDDLKLRSCMTLFAAAAGDGGELFRQALERYFAGEADPLTRERLQRSTSAS